MLKRLMKMIRKNFIMLFLILFTGVLMIVDFHQKSKIKYIGRYVLAIITSNNFSSRGTTYKYEYWIGDVKYYGSATTIGWQKRNGDLIMLEVLPDDPNISSIINTNVPHCLTINMQPIDGWETIPKDTCR